MATETQNGQDAADRAQTERVILKRETVLILPAGIDLQALLPDTATLRKMGVKAQTREAWVVVDRQTHGSKRAAIELYTGKPGTPDAKVGEFRAPSVTAWKGGLKLTEPPKPLIEAEVIE